jgi:biotin transport system substrate-specific component
MTKSISIYTYVEIALMAAIICVLSPWSISIPFSPIPITLGSFAIYMTAYVLDAKRSVVACALYLLLGLVGLPVFSGFSSGPAKLLGPTGGYLIGYLFVAFIMGFVIENFPNKVVIHFVGFLASTAILYLFGTVWLQQLMGITFGEALAMAVIPYIPLDLVKIVIACIVGPMIRKRLVAMR